MAPTVKIANKKRVKRYRKSDTPIPRKSNKSLIVNPLTEAGKLFVSKSEPITRQMSTEQNVKIGYTNPEGPSEKCFMCKNQKEKYTYLPSYSGLNISPGCLKCAKLQMEKRKLKYREISPNYSYISNGYSTNISWSRYQPKFKCDCPKYRNEI